MSIRFVHITDTHLWPGATCNFSPPKLLVDSLEINEAAVAQVDVQRPDFVVHGGDLLCGGGAFRISSADYLNSLETARRLFTQLRSPIHYIPGNHDCDPGTMSFEDFAAAIPIPALVETVQVSPEIRLALVNEYQKHPPHEGWFWSDAVHGALEKAADDALRDRCALMLFMHSWNVPHWNTIGSEKEQGFDFDYCAFKGADRLFTLVKEKPSIAAVFSGHKHLNRVSMYRDILFVDTAALIGFPMGWREVEFRDDGYFVSHFHTLNRPRLVEKSRALCTHTPAEHWEGAYLDRETEILVPRLRAMRERRSADR